MQWTLDLLLLATLSLAAIIGLAITVLGMPGNWLVVALGAGCFLLSTPERAEHVGLWPLLALVAVAGLGELLELAASALGASRLGASKRATMLAIVGSIGGAIVGLFAGAIIPIPVVGSVLGSLLLGGAGAAVGAVSGERWAGKSWDESLHVGHAAFWGRLLGTVGKVICGTVTCGIFLAAIWS
ncbi:MAG: DUF456 domain-containing protein [Pirellulaceae bacterium]|nr:DUF456 domain-containing protein [Pirellulaceae bacterium]